MKAQANSEIGYPQSVQLSSYMLSITLTWDRKDDFLERLELDHLDFRPYSEDESGCVSIIVSDPKKQNQRGLGGKLDNLSRERGRNAVD